MRLPASNFAVCGTDPASPGKLLLRTCKSKNGSEDDERCVLHPWAGVEGLPRLGLKLLLSLVILVLNRFTGQLDSMSLAGTALVPSTPRERTVFLVFELNAETKPGECINLPSATFNYLDSDTMLHSNVHIPSPTPLLKKCGRPKPWMQTL